MLIISIWAVMHYAILRKTHVFYLWPWPLTLTFTQNVDSICGLPHTKYQDCKSNGSRDMIFFLVHDFFASEFWSSPRRADRQTDRKRLLRAHRALAQVGSKSELLSRLGCMEDCGAMHLCWTIGPLLYRQETYKLYLMHILTTMPLRGNWPWTLNCKDGVAVRLA